MSWWTHVGMPATRKYRVHEIRHMHLLCKTTKQHGVEVFHASVVAVTDCSNSQSAVTTVCIYYYTVLEVWRAGIRTQFHWVNSSWESSTNRGGTRRQCFFTCLSFKRSLHFLIRVPSFQFQSQSIAHSALTSTLVAELCYLCPVVRSSVLLVGSPRQLSHLKLPSQTASAHFPLCHINFQG